MIQIQLTKQVVGCDGVADLGGGVYRIDLPGRVSRLATTAEITTAQASLDAETADLAAYQTDRADLQSQLATAAARLEQIRDAASPNNAQVIAAMRDMAQIQLRMLKYIRRL